MVVLALILWMHISACVNCPIRVETVGTNWTHALQTGKKPLKKVYCVTFYRYTCYITNFLLLCVRCHHGARCSPSSNFLDFACTCGLGYTGRLCDEDVDECVVSSPCRNGATCRNTNGSYRCVCAKGYEGRDCVINTDDCASCKYWSLNFIRTIGLFYCGLGVWQQFSKSSRGQSCKVDHCTNKGPAHCYITEMMIESWFQLHVRMVERALMGLVTTHVCVWMASVASTVR